MGGIAKKESPPEASSRHNKTPSFRTGFCECRARGKNRLSLGDLSTLDAGCAHTQPFRGAVDQRFDRLQVHIPAPARHVVSVRDVIAELRTLAADITNLCHG